MTNRLESLAGVVVAVLLAAPGYAAAHGAAAGAQDGMPLDEKAVLERLHADNQREIMLAKLTQQRAMTAGAKKVAEMILRDHQKADAELLTLAKDKGLTLAMPTPSGDVERQHLQLVQATEGFLKVAPPQDYDAVYLSTMVAAHDHAISLLLGSKGALSLKTKAMAQQLLPTLEHHRDEALHALAAIRPEHEGTGGAGTQE